MSDALPTNIDVDWAVVFVFHVCSPFSITRSLFSYPHVCLVFVPNRSFLRLSCVAALGSTFTLAIEAFIICETVTDF